MEKTLVIMAAGMGSRYGGLKQIDPVGPDNSIIIDYSVFDAVKCGFKKVVFIIKKENEQIFKETIGDKVSKHIKVEYVFQDLNNIPKGFKVPEGRVKPWGTAHAILSCKGVVNEPFMVINADDFYGRSAFKVIADWIDKADFKNLPLKIAMAGFYLKNTLTENGSVSRGICEVDENKKLIDIVERLKIMRKDGVISYTEDEKEWTPLSENAIASMNCWCFPPEFINELEPYFENFLKNEVPQNPLKAEVYLPFAVRHMLQTKMCTVDVLEATDKWVGVTYPEDKPDVVKAISKLVSDGVYSEKLWD